MSEMVEFLRARFDEDEQTARAAVSSHEREPRLVPCVAGAEWSHRYDSDDYGGTEVADGAGHVIVAMSHESGASQRIHIARHDPARVLAEVAAKRRMLDELYPEVKGADEAILGEWNSSPDNAETLLEMLALPYASHPDYRQEWAV